MHRKGSGRGMKFSCQVKWEEMDVIGSDRFCNSCNKTVIDFTRHSEEDLQAWFREYPDTCGRFLQEQVDPSLVPLDQLTLSVKRGLAITLSILALGSSHAQTENSPTVPIEQIPAAQSPHRDKEYREEISTSVIPLPIPVTTVEAVQVPEKRRFRWYVSSRFPFIHRRLHRIRGKIRLGCPSF